MNPALIKELAELYGISAVILSYNTETKRHQVAIAMDDVHSALVVLKPDETYESVEPRIREAARELWEET